MRRFSALVAGSLLAAALVVAGTATAAAAHPATKSTQPTVASVSPDHGSTNGGTSVTVKGKNLVSATSVAFGSSSTTNFTFKSAHAIVVQSPPGTGTVDVTVTTPSGTSVTNPADQFNYVVSSPAIEKVSPNRGPTVGGNKVTVIGSDFTGATTVDFGSTPGTNVTVNSDQTITVTAPAGNLGTVDVTVSGGPDGVSPVDPADQYTYTEHSPRVTSVNPDVGSAGQVVTITGAGFNKKTTTAVDFGSTPATFTVNKSTSITATAPAGSGTVDITVVTSKGTSAITSVDEFHYSDS